MASVACLHRAFHYRYNVSDLRHQSPHYSSKELQHLLLYTSPDHYRHRGYLPPRQYHVLLRRAWPKHVAARLVDASV